MAVNDVLIFISLSAHFGHDIGKTRRSFKPISRATYTEERTRMFWLYN